MKRLFNLQFITKDAELETKQKQKDTYNIIDRWRSKTCENPIYENWQQCNSRDPAI